ncbi:hypothetical protein CDL12_03443 [Handroanthus impetiginosus]|uniref:Uncharacterized protein n=1 Tax=Handroanthus impetiginosus TaxID=429701 RepID=A0A2G9I254_9LAMI|nr:hypothetical protein CDL12_03443 [Handroanthus impetiginosus]
MQCTSYVPVYYHPRDLNLGASGLSWHPFDGNANYGDERGYNISLPPRILEPYLSNDKEMLRQIMQNQEATFRYQVQELHRLYRRQRELMDEMRVGQIFAQHLRTSESISFLPHPQSDISQLTSHATSWLLRDRSHSKSEITAENIQRPPNPFAENFQGHTAAPPGPFVRKNSYNEVKFLSSRSSGNENRILDLELPADACRDDEVKQLRYLSEAPELTSNNQKKLLNIQPASDLEFCPVKTEDSLSFDSNSRKTNCFIDLNEPIHLESPPSSSTGPLESVVHKHSGFLNCDSSSDGINSSLAIDLNTTPVSCFSDMEILENGKCVEDTKIDEKFLKTETYIDLNTGVVADEPSPQLSCSVIPTKSAGDMDLKGPVSPENEECSPPRGKSEDIRLEEQSVEPDITAAQNLVMLSSQGVKEHVKNCLLWLAEIVSSTGDNLENEVMKLQDDARFYDFGTLTVSEENGLNISHVVRNEKETGMSSNRSGKGRARGTRQRTEAKDLHTTEGSLVTGSLKRNAGKKTCPKRRKCTKLSPSSMVQKSMSSVLKQGWGKVKKREGGCRRRASKFLVMS